MSDGFYRAFEERYYAPRDFIKELRRQYLPFITQLRSIYPGAETFDAGCGRGEWLELMIEQGFAPFGVDLDDGMLLGCIDLGLPAEKGDAVEYISTLPSSSQVVVSAFHVVEHISFEQLRTFVKEALRVLKPGGLLILETPNPENIVVATRNFYLDPTHQRPIPSSLLAFVTEFEGFECIKTLRLQEPKDIHSRANIGLTELLNCVSPDYAVIAQKKAEFPVSMETRKLFDVEYGMSLDALAARLDQRLEIIASQAQQAETKALQAETKALQAEAKAQLAEASSYQISLQLQSIYTSKSWRITAPLRKLMNLLKSRRQ